MILTVPQDKTLYPTLGPQVCDFIEKNLVFGPGDLRGLPVRLDDEKLALIYRMYEVFPKGHPQAGRRRFKRVGLSMPKGLGKTELAAWVAACELHPDAPVRCVGFSGSGEPIGGPVTDPYLPMVAFSAEQSDELAYGALKMMFEEGPLKDDFDIGLERIMRKRGDGKAVSLSSSPNARDGARTTFCVMDETHRWTLPRLKLAHQTMTANLAKRKMADPWMLEITTAPEPGAGSVAEATMEYAQQVDQGAISNASFFFFHRQASDDHDLTTIEGARAAVIEASGPAESWRDIEAIVSMWNDPTTDKAYWERVWCNRLVQSSTRAFDSKQWGKLARPGYKPPIKAVITLGFDGSVFHDATALVGTEIITGYQWVVGVWERPYGREEWQVPAGEVDALVRSTFEQFTVWRLYADPFRWESWIAGWIGAFGKERVLEWPTNRLRQMALAVAGFDSAMREGQMSHDGSPQLAQHIGNSKRDETLRMTDEQGKPLWTIRKDRPDSPHKIDAAMAAILSWKARTDAIAAGVGIQPKYDVMVYGGGGRR